MESDSLSQANGRHVKRFHVPFIQHKLGSPGEIYPQLWRNMVTQNFVHFQAICQARTDAEFQGPLLLPLEELQKNLGNQK